MARFAYSHPGDSLLPSASSIVLSTGTAETGYGIDKVWDGDPAVPLKISGTSMDLDMTWSAAVTPAFVALLHHNLDVAARLQGHNTNLATPDVDLPFAVPTMSAGKWFTSPFLTQSTARKKWRIHIVSNSRNIILGELWMGSAFRQFSTDAGVLLLEDTIQSLVGATLIHETNANVQLAYRRAHPTTRVSGSIVAGGADLTALTDWLEVAGGTRTFVVALDSNIANAKLVRFTSDALNFAALGNGYYRTSLSLRELSRGMPWVAQD